MSISATRDEFKIGKSMYMRLYLLPIIVFISGCLSVRPPTEINYDGGAVFRTLSSNISLAYTNHDRNISGSGYLMYQKPDHLRVVILSPFGSVLQEIYVSGDRVTIIDPGNGIAFGGDRMDLPDKGDFSGWRYIHWLIDIDPFEPLQRNGTVERINKYGQSESVSFENGLLISKKTAEGGYIRYGRYTSVQGVPLPLEITYETAVKDRFIIQLEDPEINIIFADGAFTPNLNKLRVYPLSSLK